MRLFYYPFGHKEKEKARQTEGSPGVTVCSKRDSNPHSAQPSLAKGF